MGFILEGEQAVSRAIENPEYSFVPAPAFIVRDGFTVGYNVGNSLFSCVRDEAVRRHPVDGRLWYWFPKTGRFFIGFILIDDPDRTFSFDVLIQKKFAFRVSTSRPDGFRRVYFTDRAYDLEYAQTVELLFAGDGSRQGIEGMIFVSGNPAVIFASPERVRVSRTAGPLAQPPLAGCRVINPARFPLRRELLRLPVPAPLPPRTVARMGAADIPWAACGPRLVEMLVGGTRSRLSAVGFAPGERTVPSPLDGGETDGRRLVDKRWLVRLADDRAGVEILSGERLRTVRPVLEAGGRPLPLVGATLSVSEDTGLSLLLTARFDYEGFRHETAFRFVAGSPRIEMEHLVENRTAAPFAHLSRYAVAIEEDPGGPAASVNAVRPDGSLEPVKEFSALRHSERKVDGPPGVLTHSLLRGRDQLTLGETAALAPVGLSADGARTTLELLPEASRVVCDGDEEYRIRALFFLDGGRYKLREGVSFRHRSCLRTDAPRTPAAVLYEAGRLDEPPFAACPWHEDGRRTVLDPPFARRPSWRKTLSRWIGWYVENRDATRAWGVHNYGDWFGERVNNWGNGEYDTPYGILRCFAATADPGLRKLGFAAARHMIDVDTYHGGRAHEGWQITHSMAHGGGYFPDEYRVGAYSHGGVHVSHSWVEGVLLYWRLTGDRRAVETARLMLDDLAGPLLGTWSFDNAREAGWHLIHLCGGYAALGEQRYLDAAAVLVEKILERQRVDGSLRRVLASDHCRCYPPHTGEASFMVGILLEGLKRFHGITADPAVEKAIVALARWLVADMWDARERRFRYTSCPKSGYIETAMMLEGLAYAARVSGDPRLLGLCRREFAKLSAAEMDRRFIVGPLRYGDGGPCAKIVSQRLRMFPDIAHELRPPAE